MGRGGRCIFELSYLSTEGRGKNVTHLSYYNEKISRVYMEESE